jgi:hypothetical protein
LHGGKDDMVVNNLFVDCKYAISFSPWGPKRWKEFLDSPKLQEMLHQVVDIDRPPYSTKYPALAHLYENEGVNQVWNNAACNCGKFLIRDRSVQEVLDNQVTISEPSAATTSLAPDLIESGQSGVGRLRQPGFRPIPLGEIGLYHDAWRKVGRR